MNKNLLKAKMLESGVDVKTLCAACNVSHAAFYRKMNGNSEFTQHEIGKIIELLHLDMETARRIFFM